MRVSPESRRPAAFFRRSLVLASVVAVASFITAAAQFRVTAPSAGSEFYPSDSIPISWSGNVENHLVRIEIRRNGGPWMPLRHFVADSTLNVSALPLLPGRYDLQVIRTRRDTSWYQLGPSESCWFGYNDITYSPDGALVAVVACDGSVRVWDVVSRRAVRTFALADSANAQYTRVRFSADGRLLLASAAVWPRRHSAVFDMMSGARLWSDTNAIVDMSADGSLLAVRNRVIRREDSSVVGIVGDSRSTPSELILSPDGRSAANIYGTSVLLWSVETGRFLRGFYPHWAQLIYGVEFSSDGALIAAATGLGQVSVWEVASGKYLFNGPGNGARDVTFSTDGSRVATTSFGGVLQLWESRTGEPLGTWGASNAWLSVALSPDDTHMAAVDVRGTIRVFRFEERIDTVVGPAWYRRPARVDVSMPDSSFGRVVTDGFARRGLGFLSHETVDIPLDSLWLTGPDRAAMQIFDPSPENFIIRSLSKSSFDIHFRPVRSGLHECSAIAIFDGDTIVRTMTGIAADQPVVRNIFEIKFGDVPWRAQRDTVVTFLRNVDTIAHDVTTSISKSNTWLFSYPLGLGASRLAAGDSQSIAIRFDADSGNGYYQHVLAASFDDVGSPVWLTVSASIVEAPFSGIPVSPSTDAGSIALTIRRVGEGLIGVRAKDGTSHPIDLILYNARGEGTRCGQISDSREVLIETGAPGLYFLVARDVVTRVSTFRPLPF